MKNWLIVAVLVFLFTFCQSSAQKGSPKGTMGSLNGTVVNNGERAPLNFAFVMVHGTLNDQDFRPVLDKKAHFSLQLDPGLYDVFVSYAGFVPFCKTVKITSGKSVDVDIELIPDYANLESESRSTSYLRVYRLTLGLGSWTHGQV